MNPGDFKNKLKQGISAREFNGYCVDLFHYQAENNPVYREFISLLSIDPLEVKTPEEIPFLPISFFKTHQLITGKAKPVEIFTSSGTTGSSISKHYAADPGFYLENTVRNFAEFYGSPEQYEFLALLPGYSERKGSSLIKMVDHFIRISGGGYYLANFDELIKRLLNPAEKPCLLIGVSFALLDLAEYIGRKKIHIEFPFVMETGGMKGRRKELIREEMHAILKNAFHCSSIHSEYGMTELFSQAYSKANGIFHCPGTMHVYIRNLTDPFELYPPEKTGGVNIIDLANIDSISFIATDDLGRINPDGSFQVLGRSDNSDVRGCNLMVV